MARNITREPLHWRVPVQTGRRCDSLGRTTVFATRQSTPFLAGMGGFVGSVLYYTDTDLWQ